MFSIRLVTSEKEINEFEEMRERVFNPFVSKCQYAFADAIINGDMIAMQCIKDGNPVGGVLLRLSRNNIKISRLFVIEEEQRKGAGSFMLDYVDKKRSFFEDYYGCDIEGLLIEPLESKIGYYLSKGFGFSGHQMYKKYSNKKK